MGDRSSDASALLGMEGFVVLSQSEEGGELWVLVETTATVAGCPSCGVKATGHGRSVIQVRDLPAGGCPVRLVWRKRRWLCTDPDCDATSFTVQTPAIEGSLTRRAAKEICRSVGEDGHAVAQVAREFGVGWATAMACVRRHGEPLVNDPGRIGVTEALGIDEHKVLSATKDHRTLYATSFVDVTGQLLDVVRGRSADDVAYWLTQGPPAWRQRIAAKLSGSVQGARGDAAMSFSCSLDDGGGCRHHGEGDPEPSERHRRQEQPVRGAQSRQREA